MTERRTVAYIATGITLIGGYALLRWLSSGDSPQNKDLPLQGTATPTQENFPLPMNTLPLTLTEDNGSITNGMTGAVYQKVADPTGNGRMCLQLGVYTENNKQTVFGATTAFGNPSIYNDISGPIIVYDSNNTEIGTFDTASLPDANIFSNVRPNTKVCNSSPTQ